MVPETEDKQITPEGQATDDTFRDIMDHPSNDDLRDSLNEAEENPETNKDTSGPESDLLNYISGDTSGNSKQGGLSKYNNLKKRRVIFGTAAFGGVGATIILMFSSLLPLKLEALINNATKAAAAIPEYAIEHRVEYLVTRAISARILQKAHGLNDSQIEPVFCKTRGAIGCSVLATYTSKYISDEIGLDLIKMPNGQTVKVSINEKGRQYLGGRATSWEIEYTRGMGEHQLLKTHQKIKSHREMRAYLKTKVNKKYKNALSRYVARRILMLQYGVKGWRAFEKTREKIDNKIADTKTRFKAGVATNTIGKISPRFTAYLACFQGGTEPCEKILKTLDTNLGIVEKPTDRSDPDYDKKMNKYEKWEKQKNGISKIQQRISGELGDVKDTTVFGKTISKLFSSKVAAALTGVGVAVAAADTLDLVLSGVYALNNGAASEVGLDMNSMVYTGFAFGDDTGIVPNWEKIKLGETDDSVTGSEVLSEMASLIDCDGSPLCAQENGYPTAHPSTARANTSTFSRECPSPDGYKMVQLPEGQLVCPSFMLIKDYTEAFKNNPLWQSSVLMSEAWMSSGAHTIVSIYRAAVGAVFNAATGPFLSIPGVKDVFSSISGWAAEQMKPIMDFAMGLIFDPAIVGYGVPPSLNYDGLSGALHVTKWETLRNGTVDGQTLGAGGQYLTKEDAQKIIAYREQEDADTFASLPLMDRLLNIELKGSLIQRLALSSPDNISELALLPKRALYALTNMSTSSATPSSQVNPSPFGLPLYGYKLDDPALSANPGTYGDDPGVCEAYSKSREDSLYKDDSTVISVHRETDPCALEKIATGMIVTASNPSDPYAFQPIGSVSASSSASDSAGSSASTGEVAWIIDRKWYDNPSTHYGVMKGHQANSGFYYKYSDNQRYAVDISPPGINGAPLYALVGGKVTRVNLPSSVAGGNGGLEITSTLPNGKVLKHLYAHNHTSVKLGDEVATGSRIGTVGSVGNSAVPHIHLEINYGGSPICGNDIFPLLANNQPVDFNSLAKKATPNCRGRK